MRLSLCSAAASWRIFWYELALELVFLLDHLHRNVLEHTHQGWHRQVKVRLDLTQRVGEDEFAITNLSSAIIVLKVVVVVLGNGWQTHESVVRNGRHKCTGRRVHDRCAIGRQQMHGSTICRTICRGSRKHCRRIGNRRGILNAREFGHDSRSARKDDVWKEKSARNQ